MSNDLKMMIAVICESHLRSNNSVLMAHAQKVSMSHFGVSANEIHREIMNPNKVTK